MKYFISFTLLLSSIIVWTGYKASAQTNHDTLLESLYQNTKSFFDETMYPSDNTKCLNHIHNRYVNTNLFEFYRAVALVDLIRSNLESQGFNPDFIYNPALTKAVAHKTDVINNISLEDINLMQQELEELKSQWDSCLENDINPNN